MATSPLRLDRRGPGFVLTGRGAERFKLIDDYLDYLADRAYSAHTIEAYAFDLLSFARWLESEQLALEAVTTDSLVRYLAACRLAPVRGRPGGNVYSIRDGRSTGFAPSTINRRLAAISGLFSYRQMLDPGATNPVPRGKEARRATSGERSGALGHLGRLRSRSRLRLREPRRLPRALDRDELRGLIGSFRTHRDRSIAGLMVFSGLRSAEVLSLRVRDVDIGRGWVQVIGKGDKERRVPLDPDVASLIQTYLLAERPETTSTALFVVAKGPHRGQPLTAAGLRTVFRYHRTKTGVTAGHPHALRHTFGTALAEAGVDLAIIQALMGHDHVDSAATYIHLAPIHLRSAYDAARARQRAES
jgi:site-specific recombinase XerD